MGFGDYVYIMVFFLILWVHSIILWGFILTTPQIGVVLWGYESKLKILSIMGYEVSPTMVFWGVPFTQTPIHGIRPAHIILNFNYIILRIMCL